jgi:ribonuclease HII
MTVSVKTEENDFPQNLEVEQIIWNSGMTHIAGVDEAGCGPLAGPVVAAVVVFPQEYYNPRIKDSKKLSAMRREEIYQQIIENTLAYAVGVVHHTEIDRMNIRQATFKAMRKALGTLTLKPDYILFDGYELPEKLFPQEAIINGDSHSFTIAAASIVAKVSRDRMMLENHLKYPQYGFDRNKGYGTAFHRDMLKKHGPCPLHRRSFLSRILEEKKS